MKIDIYYNIYKIIIISISSSSSSSSSDLTFKVNSKMDIPLSVIYNEQKKRIAYLKTLYKGGAFLADKFSDILSMAVNVIRNYERATETAPLSKHTAFAVLDTLFYDPDNKSKRGFTLTEENIEFIKQYLQFIVGGRLGWHVDEYVQQLSIPVQPDI